MMVEVAMRSPQGMDGVPQGRGHKVRDPGVDGRILKS
jgi:hypothetical protein